MVRMKSVVREKEIYEAAETKNLVELDWVWRRHAAAGPDRALVNGALEHSERVRFCEDHSKASESFE